MCRFLVYRGESLFMADLLTRSEHSLIKQSYHARERTEPLNGDGFGVGWYDHGIDGIPCVFTSVRPAWSNRNLHRLADKIRSTCFFAHVRAATPGSPVSDLNCHPFQYRQLLWMHNGRIREFGRLRRHLLESLSDEVFDIIQGGTDSEHAFALFLNHLWPNVQHTDTTLLVDAMRACIRTIEDWSRAAGITEPSYCNFAVTDGYSVVVSRYASDPGAEPATLYYTLGSRFENRDGTYEMAPVVSIAGAAIVASEPITSLHQSWYTVPRNHLLVLTPELEFSTHPLHA